MSLGTGLHTAIAARGSLCAGIDPHAALLAEGLPTTSPAWNARAHGRRGARAARLGGQAAVGVLRAVRQPRHRGVRAGDRGVPAAGALVLLDVKRGDIGSTSQAYADAYLDPSSPLASDAITASPYLGFGSLDPLVETARRHGAGLLVLALTSNKTGLEVQRDDPDGRTVAGTKLDHLRALQRRG